MSSLFLCPILTAQQLSSTVVLTVKDYFASGSDATTKTLAPVSTGSSLLYVEDSSSFLLHQGILMRLSASPRREYLGSITAIKNGKVAIDPPLPVPLPAGAVVRHNDARAFLSAVAALKASGSGGKLFMPKGTYNLDETSIPIDFNNFALEGEGRGSTSIRYTGTGCAFKGAIGSTTLQYHLSFKSFSLLAYGSDASGICLYRPMYVTIDETYIENTAPNQTGHALVIDGSNNFGTGVIIKNNRLNQWKTAVLLTGNPAAGYIVRSKLEDNEIDGKSPLEPGSVAIELNLCQNCQIDGGNIEQWETGIRITGRAVQNVLSFIRFEDVNTVWSVDQPAVGTQTIGNMFSRDAIHLEPSTTSMFNDQSTPTRFVSQVAADGFLDLSVAQRPLCEPAHRGEIYIEKGAARVADQPYVCVKKSDDSYTWVQLAIVQ